MSTVTRRESWLDSKLVQYGVTTASAVIVGVAAIKAARISIPILLHHHTKLQDIYPIFKISNFTRERIKDEGANALGVFSGFRAGANWLGYFEQRNEERFQREIIQLMIQYEQEMQEKENGELN